MYFSDIVGLVGVLSVLIAYFMLQTHRLKSDTVSYSLYNTLGSVFIIYSLLFKWNLSAFVMEGAWLILSAYGTYQAWHRHKKGK